MREFCSLLRFWEFCGNSMCKHAKACAGDGEACFRHFWPQLPEEVKVVVRAHFKAGAAGMSKPEIVDFVKRECVRWREVQAKMAADQAAEAPPPAKPRLPAQPRVL